LKKVALAKDNKTVTITFNEDVKPTAIGTKKIQLAALKEAISLSTDSTSPVPTYLPLSDFDVIELRKDQLTIKLATPLSGDANRIFIAEEMLKDIHGNINDILSTSLLIADEMGPQMKKVILPANKKNLQIVVNLNESIFNALEVEKALLKSALKAAVSISTDADLETPTFQALTERDRVNIKSAKGQLVIDLSTKLVVGKTYMVKINAEALKDLTGNKSVEIITEKFTVDLIGPNLGWPEKI
jgi:hypothetical protein